MGVWAVLIVGKINNKVKVKVTQLCLTLCYPMDYTGVALVAQLVKNPPAMQETWVQSLGWEDHLEKERLPTPVFWPGEFHEPYGPWGHKESDMTE